MSGSRATSPGDLRLLEQRGDAPECRCELRRAVGADHATAGRQERGLQDARVVHELGSILHAGIQRELPVRRSRQACRRQKIPRAHLVGGGFHRLGRVGRQRQMLRGMCRQQRGLVLHAHHRVQRIVLRKRRHLP
jgi:hypothetical protein